MDKDHQPFCLSVTATRFKPVIPGKKNDVNHASKFCVEEEEEEFKINIDQEISTNESHNAYDNVDFKNADNLPTQTI